MKRLACIFGGHRWTMRDEDGEVYEVCSRCGKQSVPLEPEQRRGDRGVLADEHETQARCSRKSAAAAL